jgi:hypothetical protein
MTLAIFDHPSLSRELHKKDDSLRDGHLARPCIISGQIALHHKKFWDIFLIGSLQTKFKPCVKPRLR